MDEILPFLASTLCFLPLLIVSVVLSLVALVRTRRVMDLAVHVKDLQREVARLRHPATPSPEPPAAEGIVAAFPEARPREVARPRSRLALPALADAVSLEEWLGRRGLGWAAVVLLLFAAAFFIKHAYDNNWVGPLGRVATGVVAGATLCVAGYRAHRLGYRLFSQMLTSAGAVLLYLATFAAFGYYHLLPRDWAAVFLVAVIAETAALAILYDAPAIALMAVVGALLNPVLLRTDHDQYQNLFTYLIVVNLGVVGIALFRAWRIVPTVALVGTQLLFWGWWNEHYHPEKLRAALSFQCAVYLTFVTHQMAAHVLRPRAADVEALGRVVVNAFLFAAASYILLWEDYRPWLGTAAVGLAVVYTALTWLVLRRRPEDVWQQVVLVATGLAFVTMAIPLQAEAIWIALGWAAEGAALTWFGIRVRSLPLRGFGAALLGLGVGRLLVIDTMDLSRWKPFVAVFNGYALPALLVAACVLLAAAAVRWMQVRPRGFDLVLQWVAGVGGVLLVWLILSIETYDYFTARMHNWREDPEHLRRVARTSLSVLWPVYAALLLGLGFWLHSDRLRWTALGLFGLTLGKVVLIDLADLPGFYRVTAFLVLALLMGSAAWGYQKIERLRHTARTEGHGS